MKSKRLQFRTQRTAAILTVAGLIIVCALTTFSQSGRRVKKAASLPPVPTPEASPTPTPKKSPEKPTTPVFIGVNSYDRTANIPLYFTDSIGRSCAERLSERSTIRVDLSAREVNRGEAVKRAKEARLGFVVLLELRSDRMRSDGRNSDLSQLYIEYAVFAAGTGRQLTSGNVSQQTGFRDIMVGRDSTRTAENRLKQAARVAAGRILNVIIEHEP